MVFGNLFPKFNITAHYVSKRMIQSRQGCPIHNEQVMIVRVDVNWPSNPLGYRSSGSHILGATKISFGISPMSSFMSPLKMCSVHVFFSFERKKHKNVHKNAF